MKYRWKTRPYVHQVLAVKELLRREWGGALLMEPRTGKTKIAIDWISILHMQGKVDRVVVFAPVSVIGVWVEQIEMHCPLPCQVLVWDKRGRKKNELPRVGTGVLSWVLINYDAMSTPGRVRGRDEHGSVLRSRSRGGRFDVKRGLKRWQPDAMILDESHRIKSASARKSTAIHSFRTVPHRLIMTGTVVTKKKRIFDIYSQWKFLNQDKFKNFTFAEFKSEFALFTSRNGYPQFLRNRNEKRLRTMIHQDSFAITRAECYDLPPRLPPEIIRVPLEETAELYDEMAASMVAKIHTGEITEASIPLVLGLRLAQITSGIARTEPTEAYPKGRLVRVGREKLRMVEDRLVDFFEAEEKVVISARFIADLEALVALCKKLGAETYLLRGGMKLRDRDHARRSFQAYEGAASFVMQPQAGSLGIDLSTAGTFIWYSLTPSYVDFTQAEDRIALNPYGTRFIYFLGEGTYDEIQYASLREDEDVAKTIMRKPESILREHSWSS